MQESANFVCCMITTSLRIVGKPYDPEKYPDAFNAWLVFRRVVCVCSLCVFGGLVCCGDIIGFSIVLFSVVFLLLFRFRARTRSCACVSDFSLVYALFSLVHTFGSSHTRTGRSHSSVRSRFVSPLLPAHVRGARDVLLGSRHFHARVRRRAVPG